MHARRFAYDTDSHSEEERRVEPVERRSSLTELGIKLSSLIMPLKTLVNDVVFSMLERRCFPLLACRSPVRAS